MYSHLILLLIFGNSSVSVVGYSCFGSRTLMNFGVMFPSKVLFEDNNTAASIFGLP